MGSNAVTDIGSASVIHQMAIQSEEAKTALEASFKSAGLKNKRVKKNIVGPKKSPIVLEDIRSEISKKMRKNQTLVFFK